MEMVYLRKKKILLVLLILVGVSVFFLGEHFIHKKTNNYSNEIEKQDQTKESNIDFEAEKDDTASVEKEDENHENNQSKEIEEGDELTINNNEMTEENIKKDVPSKFELHTLEELQYYLYIPSNPTNDMPLIMYLHGGTNKKANVEELLTIEGFPKYLYEGEYGDLRAYVVVPKLTTNYVGWSDISDDLKNLIEDININYGIDTNKVALTGHSMGGTGTYQVQVKLPNTFACIAPMSGSIKNTEENLNALSKTKIWAFIGTNDTIVKPASTRIIIDSLKKRGADVKITEYQDADHFAVSSLGYKDKEFINWLVNCGN